MGANVFANVPADGTVYNPTGQTGYDTAFASASVAGWRYIATGSSAAPSISAHPAAQSIETDETAACNVTATGNPARDYP